MNVIMIFPRGRTLKKDAWIFEERFNSSTTCSVMCSSTIRA